MPERALPKVIKLTRRPDPKDFSLTIDGEEFPYVILEEDLRVEVQPEHMPAIRVTLIADRVEVINDWGDLSEGERTAL